MAKAVDTNKLAGIHSFADWLCEVSYIAAGDKRGSIRSVNEARKEAAADLRYEGYSDREIKAIFCRVEKYFGLI